MGRAGAQLLPEFNGADSSRKGIRLGPVLPFAALIWQAAANTAPEIANWHVINHSIH
jgi:hypothetical protein